MVPKVPEMVASSCSLLNFAQRSSRRKFAHRLWLKRVVRPSFDFIAFPCVARAYKSAASYKAQTSANQGSNRADLKFANGIFHRGRARPAHHRISFLRTAVNVAVRFLCQLYATSTDWIGGRKSARSSQLSPSSRL